MEAGGKWPEDLEPLRKLKRLFHLEMKELLNDQLKLFSNPSNDHIDVFHDGFVYRLIVSVPKEIVVLKRSQSEPESKQAIALERLTQHLPIVSSALNGVNRTYSAYSATVRFVKRWLSCHVLFSSMNEEMIDLMVASLFIHSYPHIPPK